MGKVNRGRSGGAGGGARAPCGRHEGRWAQTPPPPARRRRTAPRAAPAAPRLLPPRRRPRSTAGDTAWVLISAALVMLMTRPASPSSTAAWCAGRTCWPRSCRASSSWRSSRVQWVLWGYSLAFGPDNGGIIGGLDWFGLTGVGGDAERRLRGHHPAPGVHDLPDDVRGHHARAHHRRVRRADEVLRVPGLHRCSGPPSSTTRSPTGSGASAAGSGTWARSTSRAAPSCTSAPGVAALVAALVIGKRQGLRPGADAARTTCRFTVLGAALLWFGWFGFNAGSALAANGLAANAFVDTNTAAAAAALAWMFVEWMHARQADRARAPPRARWPGWWPSPRRRVRRPRWPPSSSAWLAGCLCYGAVHLKPQARLRRLARRRRRPRRRRHLGRARHRALRHQAGQPAGGDGLFYGNPQPVLDPVRRRCGALAYSFVVTTSSSRSSTLSSACASPTRTRSSASTSRSTPRPPTRSAARLLQRVLDGRKRRRVRRGEAGGGEATPEPLGAAGPA